jgi:hypothetical protein
MEWFFVVLLVGALLLAWRQHENKKTQIRREAQRVEQQRLERRNLLAAKYAESPFKDDILNGNVRVGMTVDELIDSWGRPVAIDERVLKTKVVHTYKYAQISTRSFRQKVKVENGIVVGWSNT